MTERFPVVAEFTIKITVEDPHWLRVVFVNNLTRHQRDKMSRYHFPSIIASIAKLWRQDLGK